MEGEQGSGQKRKQFNKRATSSITIKCPDSAAKTKLSLRLLYVLSPLKAERRLVKSDWFQRHNIETKWRDRWSYNMQRVRAARSSVHAYTADCYCRQRCSLYNTNQTPLLLLNVQLTLCLLRKTSVITSRCGRVSRTNSIVVNAFSLDK